jgi:uncharacterized protein (TIGR02391 family)
MTDTRTIAILNLLDSLGDADLKHYFADPEPRDQWDSYLTGQMKALCGYCRTLGLTELVPAMDEFLPLNGNALEALNMVNSFVVPEVRHHLATTDVESVAGSTSWFWELVHPRIRAVARTRFEAGFFADAVEASFKEVNNVVKGLVRELNGTELDGAGLMTTAFSPQKPLIRLTPLETESDRSVQQGFMQIMAGAMTGIRNPNAHGNLNLSRSDAMHLISLGSLLMNRVDGRV